MRAADKSGTVDRQQFGTGRGQFEADSGGRGSTYRQNVGFGAANYPFLGDETKGHCNDMATYPTSSQHE